MKINNFYNKWITRSFLQRSSIYTVIHGSSNYWYYLLLLTLIINHSYFLHISFQILIHIYTSKTYLHQNNKCWATNYLNQATVKLITKKVKQENHRSELYQELPTSKKKLKKKAKNYLTKRTVFRKKAPYRFPIHLTSREVNETLIVLWAVLNLIKFKNHNHTHHRQSNNNQIFVKRT